MSSVTAVPLAVPPASNPASTACCAVAPPRWARGAARGSCWLLGCLAEVAAIPQLSNCCLLCMGMFVVMGRLRDGE